MSIATEPRRGPGRPPRNGGPPPPPKPETAAQQPPRPQETATQELARLQALRDANSGFLVPKPAGIDGAKLIIRDDVQGIPEPDAAAKRAMQWFRDIAAAGGNSADLMLAWHAWGAVTGEANPKRPLEAPFEALAIAAGRRHVALMARAEEEQRPAKLLQAARANVRQLEAEFMRESKFLLPLKARLERARAELAALEVTR
jgi:hypothetical protein